MRWLLRPALALLFALALSATVVWAVGTTGEILGIVTDPQGAVVSSAKVTLTNTETNVSQTATTDSNGKFDFVNLPPGTYRIRIEKQGFRSVALENVEVKVAVTTRVDTRLEVGQFTEIVVVSETGAKVETTNIALGSTVNTSLLVNLPLVNRNYTDLVFTQPGVVSSSDRFGTPSVSGNRTQANNYLLEGVDNNDLPLNTPLAQPSPDSLEEFRLITNTINPEYGRNSGSVVNAVTKSGTNDIHGDVFYFYRGKGLNSNTFFNNKAGVAKPDFNRNLWGTTVGGPVYIPGVYNGRNRTFWFFSYQGVHQITPQVVAGQRVFTAAERDLNNTGVADWSANCPRASTADPCFTRRVSGVLQNRGTADRPFVDSNGVTQPAGTPFSVLWPNGQIPTVNFDPVAVGILNGFPNLNIPAVPLPNSGLNFFQSYRQPLNNYQVSAKGDENFAGGHHLSLYFFRQNQVTTRQIPFTGATIPGFGDHSTSKIQRATINYSHVFNSRIINEGRIGWSRLDFGAVLPNNVFDPKALGFTGINAQDLTVASAPNIVIGQGWFDYGFSRNGPQPRIDETFQYADNLSIIRGKHNFKFGFDIRQQRITNPFFFAHNGEYICQGSPLAASTNESTRVAGLDFLLGNCQVFQQGSPGQNIARANGYYVYGQDVLQLTRSFTLTLGVGWDMEQPYKQLFGDGNNMYAFRPGVQSTVFPTAPKGLLFPTDPGIPRGTIPLRKKNFAPRVGIAWSPSSDRLRVLTGGPGKFSIRAGYGIYYNIVEEETSLQFLFTFPFSLIKVTLLPTNANPYQAAAFFGTTANPFPYTPPAPGDTSVDFSTAFPINTSVLDPLQRLPYAQNWNLTIERELPANIIFRAGYVGSKGTHLYSTEEILDGPGRAALTGIDPVLGDPNVWQSIGNQTTNGNSIYHSLQLSAEKRIGHGLYFLGAYTLGKSIDTNSGFEDVSNTPRNLAADRALSAFDARHRFTLVYNWDLPGPKHGILGRVAGGWSTSGFATFQSGFAVTLTDGNNICDDSVSVAFFGSWCRPDRVGNVTFTDPRKDPGNLLFTASAFAEPTSGNGTSARSFFAGPGINNWDMAILKRVNLDEKRYFQLRFEFFNAFNHAQFLLGSGDFASTNFGRATDTRTIQGAQRVIQLGAKFFW
jgi:hypothetical protein